MGHQYFPAAPKLTDDAVVLRRRRVAGGEDRVVLLDELEDLADLVDGFSVLVDDGDARTLEIECFSSLEFAGLKNVDGFGQLADPPGGSIGVCAGCART